MHYASIFERQGTMSTLHELLSRPDREPEVIDACCALVEREVAAKKGLSGMALKTSFALVLKIRPRLVRDTVTRLLPEFAQSLEDVFQKSQQSSGAGDRSQQFRDALIQDPARTAEALLAVTDKRISSASEPIRKVYAKLRDNARDQVQRAVPGLAEALSPFVDS